MKRLLCAVLALCLLALSGCTRIIQTELSETTETIYSYSETASSASSQPEAGSTSSALEMTPKVVDGDVGETTSVEPSEISDDYAQTLSCYSALDDEQCRIYRIILSAAQKMTYGFITLGKCDADFITDISVAYKAVSLDFPEIFWLPYTYLVSNSGTERRRNILIAFEYSNNGSDNSYLITKSQRAAMKAQLEDCVSQIADYASKYEDAYEREVFLHDLLCENVEYNADGGDLVYTAYGALINGQAVCEGYSRAFQLLCEKSGIPCVPVCGIADGGGHMWNIVTLGNSNYHVDVTWDDRDTTSYSYLNLNDEKAQKSHTAGAVLNSIRANEINDGTIYNYNSYVCNSTEYNYFYRSGLIFDRKYTETVSAGIINSYQYGEKSAQFMFFDDALENSFEADYMPYVKAIQNKINRTVGKNIINLSNISIVDSVVTFYW